MKMSMIAVSLAAALALGACSKQADGGNGAAADATTNVDLGAADANASLGNGVDLDGNALDTSNALEPSSGTNASNAL